MTISIPLSIDVPDLEVGPRFYGAVFGFAKVARPLPTMTVCGAGHATLRLHEKPEGSAPALGSDDPRRQTRHWTPVHLDLHMPALDTVLARVRAEGGAVERKFGSVGRKDVAVCSHAFGHGFGVIEDAGAGRTDHDTVVAARS